MSSEDFSSHIKLQLTLKVEVSLFVIVEKIFTDVILLFCLLFFSKLVISVQLPIASETFN